MSTKENPGAAGTARGEKTSQTVEARNNSLGQLLAQPPRRPVAAEAGMAAEPATFVLQQLVPNEGRWRVIFGDGHELCAVTEDLLSFRRFKRVCAEQGIDLAEMSARDWLAEADRALAPLRAIRDIEALRT